MPIYAYKCESCGYAKDVLRKMSDAPLTDCPQCGTAHFRKQLTSAGFQLKGSGWYVTDFRSGNNGASASKAIDAEAAASSVPETKPGDGAAASAPSTTPVSATPASAGSTAVTPSSKGAGGDASSRSS